MEYKPITAVWEITMGCNMRCKHCGSSCENPLAGELTTDEAVKLCEDIGKLGLKWVTLSGGEPTTRKDWDIIAKALMDNNVIPNMITNGWLLDEKLIKRAEAAKVNTIAISIDGVKDTHDYIRRPGAFDKAISALDLIRNSKVRSAVITTINSKNIKELDQLKEIFIEHGVETWQLQIGLPMGNLSHNKELIAEPEIVNDIIDFSYETMKEGKINIDLADCIGYYTDKDALIRSNLQHKDVYNWNGCGAGIYNFGILNNGDILGCTSIRSKDFIEGNIRERNLIDIWNDKKSFMWNREMKKEDLKGTCSKCQYGQLCRGGCSNIRLTHNNTIYSENKYCSYNLALMKAKNQLLKINDINILIEKARFFIEHESYQLAEVALSIAVEMDKHNLEILNLLGFVHYMLGNYILSKKVNDSVIEEYPTECYATKGLGLALIKLGNIDEGLKYLYKSVELIDGSYLDPYYDLAITLVELGQEEKAIGIIDEATKKYPEFQLYKERFYKVCINEERLLINKSC